METKEKTSPYLRRIDYELTEKGILVRKGDYFIAHCKKTLDIILNDDALPFRCSSVSKYRVRSAKPNRKEFYFDEYRIEITTPGKRQRR